MILNIQPWYIRWIAYAAIACQVCIVAAILFAAMFGTCQAFGGCR